jgi:hypothetical protein
MLQRNVKRVLVIALVIVLAAVLGFADWQGLNFTW